MSHVNSDFSSCIKNYIDSPMKWVNTKWWYIKYSILISSLILSICGMYYYLNIYTYTDMNQYENIDFVPSVSPVQNIQQAPISWENISYVPLLSTNATSINIPVTDIYEGKEFTESFWWKENILFINDTIFRVIYPAWSFSPWESTVRGGAWFFYTPLYQWEKEIYGLEYNLKFDPNFEFIKWWKLPWLCAWDCPRWGENSTQGFSTRIMWRKNGDMELYAYLPNSKKMFWTSFGRWMYQFEKWKEYTIRQEIKRNSIWKNDGVINIYVNENLVYSNNEIEFFASTNKKVKVFFSTFFWGSDISWATPNDTYIDFKNIIFYYES